MKPRYIQELIYQAAKGDELASKLLSVFSKRRRLAKIPTPVVPTWQQRLQQYAKERHMGFNTPDFKHVQQWHIDDMMKD